jgi:hypothetical protein
MRFTALFHQIYALETLRLAYLSLQREAAPGVDGETWRHYGEDLEACLLGARLLWRLSWLNRLLHPSPAGTSKASSKGERLLASFLTMEA